MRLHRACSVTQWVRREWKGSTAWGLFTGPVTRGISVSLSSAVWVKLVTEMSRAPCSLAAAQAASVLRLLPD
ncbi:hypothetical protein GCM10009771_18960 [Nesterenkonia flava]